MSEEKKYDDHSGTETTGHEWDGIEELNTPMPRWWLWTFYATILFSIGYVIAMPAIPLLKSHTKGVLGHSDRAAVASELAALQQGRSAMSQRLIGASLEEIQSDKALNDFAMAAGKSAFGDNCATCHGSGGQGFPGYPSLADDVWIWGGSFEDIRHTLEVGIRSAHDEARYSIMQGYGEYELLSKDEIKDTVQYVLKLSGQDYDSVAAARGETHYAAQCVSCHGTDGLGDRMQGAPNLTDQEWLYGGNEEAIYQSLFSGRQGVMPNWNERLAPETITALAVYVHALGGGEASLDGKNAAGGSPN